MTRTVCMPYSGIEKPIVVIYLCDSSNGRSWIVRHGFLVYGDRRGESSDFSYFCLIGCFWYDHTSVGREWFEITLLSLSIECIECEWRFPRTWYPSHDDKLIFRDFYTNILEIMSLCIDNFDKFRHILEVRCKKYPDDFFDSCGFQYSSALICRASRWYDIIEYD